MFCGLCSRVLGSLFLCFGVFALRSSFSGLRFLRYRIGGVSIYLQKVGKSLNTNIKNFVIALHKKLVSLTMSIAAVCKFVNS